MPTITYQGTKLIVPDWPGTGHEGSYFMRGNLIAGRHSVGYGRASHNPKAGLGIQDSADEQAVRYREFVHDWGTVDIGIHLDPSASAGISTLKARENFAHAMEQVRTDPRGVHVVWVLTSSRMSRGDIPFDELFRTLAAHGVLLAVSDRIYNPANFSDQEAWFTMYASDRTATVAPRIASRRGIDRALREGRALGRPPYGLRRDRNQVPPWDVPDTVRPEHQPAPAAPAEVVTEIFRRITAGDRESAIAATLEARQVLMPWAATGVSFHKAPRSPFAWSETTVAKIAANPAYAGLRTSKGRVLEDVEARIKPLISEAQFWSAQQAIADRRKIRAQPPRREQPSMLAGAARCGACGGPLTTGGGGRYTCGWRSHCSVRQDALDMYVSRKIIAWLASPQTGLLLAAPGEDDTAEAEAARGEVARLQHQIDQLRELGENSPADYNPAEVVREITRLQRQQQAAEQHAGPSPVDPLLATVLGPDAAEKWHGTSGEDKRRLVSMITEVTLLPVPAGRPRGMRYGSLPPDRVRLACKIPGTVMPEPAGQQPWVPASAGRGSRIAAWLAEAGEPATMAEIAAGLGMPVWMAQRAVRCPLDDGRITRQRGTGEHWNTWYYRPASGGRQGNRQGE